MYKDVAKNIDQFKIVYPNTSIPSPSEDDYNQGYIRRHFVRKANDINAPIFEVDRDVLQKYSIIPFWITTTIRWRITGPIEQVVKADGGVEDIGVKNSNREAILFVKDKIPTLGLYIPDLTQFHISKKRNS
jgi:hypothetical protein